MTRRSDQRLGAVARWAADDREADRAEARANGRRRNDADLVPVLRHGGPVLRRDLALDLERLEPLGRVHAVGGVADAVDLKTALVASAFAPLLGVGLCFLLPAPKPAAAAPGVPSGAPLASRSK
mgnify:CR=1 FL=1